jgi:hypothetical protein
VTVFEAFNDFDGNPYLYKGIEVYADYKPSSNNWFEVMLYVYVTSNVGEVTLAKDAYIYVEANSPIDKAMDKLMAHLERVYGSKVSPLPRVELVVDCPNCSTPNIVNKNMYKVRVSGKGVIYSKDPRECNSQPCGECKSSVNILFHSIS